MGNKKHKRKRMKRSTAERIAGAIRTHGRLINDEPKSRGDWPPRGKTDTPMSWVQKPKNSK